MRTCDRVVWGWLGLKAAPAVLCPQTLGRLWKTVLLHTLHRFKYAHTDLLSTQLNNECDRVCKVTPGWSTNCKLNPDSECVNSWMCNVWIPLHIYFKPVKKIFYKSALRVWNMYVYLRPHHLRSLLRKKHQGFLNMSLTLILYSLKNKPPNKTNFCINLKLQGKNHLQPLTQRPSTELFCVSSLPSTLSC